MPPSASPTLVGGRDDRSLVRDSTTGGFADARQNCSDRSLARNARSYSHFSVAGAR